MNLQSLQELGITSEDIINKIVDKCSEELLTTFDCNFDDDCGDRSNSRIIKIIQNRIKNHIDKKVIELADTHILPKVSEIIENTVLQETNKWGEAKGEKISFVEYLIHRANKYMIEEVDKSFETKSESGSYQWKKHCTRIEFMITKYLYTSIETAMKQSLDDIKFSISSGLENAVKMALEGATTQLRVGVIKK